MFKDLRQNAQFFIFDKGDSTSLKIGSVVAVSPPVIKPQSNFSAGYQLQQPEYIVDVRVKVGEDVMNFNQLPANLALADFSGSGTQKIVISGNRDLIRTEVESTLANSKAIVESVTKHEATIQECERILKEVNPAFAKEKEQEEQIKGLEKQIAEMKGQLSGIAEIKSMLLNQQNANTSNNNTKKQ